MRTWAEQTLLHVQIKWHINVSTKSICSIDFQSNCLQNVLNRSMLLLSSAPEFFLLVTFFHLFISFSLVCCYLSAGFTSAHPAGYDEHRLDGKFCQVNFTCTLCVCTNTQVVQRNVSNMSTVFLQNYASFILPV